ncbi:hypothetical protein [Kaistia adipata]|uniref:hypothetical protein n=1 Tax=Kaistia adipata TaxID=166954 RepID=UPI0004245D9D|nr:hypothetical protein [Kaistia adipata]
MNRFTFRLRARHGLRLVAIGIGLAALFVSDAPTQGPAWPSLVSRAEAIIGRPLTPLSYAGVARRTTRRDYGAYAAPYVAAPYVAAPRAGCVRVVDAYGRVTWRCV